MDTKDYNLILEMFKRIKQDELNYIYRGEFTPVITDNILSLAERNIEQNSDSSHMKKKVYFIMVESLQNITRYQKNEVDLLERNAFFFIQKMGERYFITTGNLMDAAKVDNLKEQLERINCLDKTELKSYYKDVLMNGEFTPKGGAGLGLINMARKSGNKLGFAFSQINNKYAYFYLHTEITSNNKAEELGQHSKQMLDYAIRLNDVLIKYHILFLFNSILTQESLIGVLVMLEKQWGQSTQLRKKIFNIVVEMLQNILHHGAEGPEKLDGKPGILIFMEKKKCYLLHAGNYILKKEIAAVETSIRKINKMSIDELNEFYNMRLFDFEIESSQKAGLGFIDMRLKSLNDITYNTFSVDDQYSFLTIEIMVEK